jgi:spoIIIJ-associated protein
MNMNQQSPNNQKIHEDVYDILQQLLQRMNVPATIERTELLETPCFQVQSRDNNLLVGERGQHLYALQTIVKRIAEHRNNELCPPFLVDINDYQRHHIEELKERVHMSAQRVRYFKKEVVMQPMNGYERRIVHVALMEDPDVKTESIGEGESRRVVIKPV